MSPLARRLNRFLNGRGGGEGALVRRSGAAEEVDLLDGASAHVCTPQRAHRSFRHRFLPQHWQTLERTRVVWKGSPRPIELWCRKGGRQLGTQTTGPSQQLPSKGAYFHPQCSNYVWLLGESTRTLRTEVLVCLSQLGHLVRQKRNSFEGVEKYSSEFGCVSSEVT